MGPEAIQSLCRLDICRFRFRSVCGDPQKEKILFFFQVFSVLVFVLKNLTLQYNRFFLDLVIANLVLK